jgi:hypothetical protein
MRGRLALSLLVLLTAASCGAVHAASADGGAAAAEAPTRGELLKKPTKEIRALLKRYGAACEGCAEKAD